MSSFDDAVEGELANRRFREELRSAEAAKWESAATSAQGVVDEFLTLMAKAGNPGLRQFKQSRGKDTSLRSLLPDKRIAGWPVGQGSVIATDGKVFARLLGTDQVAGGPGTDIGQAFFHSTSIDGKPYGPYSADEVRQRLAPVLIDAGVLGS